VRRLYWILERLAAALLGAVLVGMLAGAIMSAVDYVTSAPDPACASGVSACISGSKWSSIRWGIGAALYIGAIYAIVVGTIPGLVALTLTPARKRPWRSLPILVLASLAGFLVVFVFNSITHRGIFESVIGTVAFFLVPILTGLLTAWNIERLPAVRPSARRD
jgi:uncharacterized membrane protein YeaQ/YmgE (transglycosylase-associated protein family)